MTPGLTILRPGLATTIQDLGRTGFQELGVPVAGALDPIGLKLANALVGNPPGEGGIELAYAGPTLRVDADSVRIAVLGDVRVTLGGQVLAADRSHVLRRGETVSIGAVTGASVAYLAVAGGLALTPFLGSVSTHLRAGIGRKFEPGAVLPLRLAAAPDREERGLAVPMNYGDGPIRVIPGPQEDRFTPDAMALFLSAEYRVGNDSDRMGLRLTGPVLAHRKGADIASDALISGCIQVPGTGQPIILLADHQTTGGYAKIATVISADLPRLGRATPGTLLRFAAVTIAEAEEARRRLEADYRRSLESIGAQNAIGKIDVERLYTDNLLSGIVDAKTASEEE